MFVSYAQNYEDVALWRTLKHVEGGFYVDLGAQHPVIDSVSRAFYERGWRGVHVEPVPHYAELIRADRPGETVVEKAIGASRGRATFHVMLDSGLSTLSEDGAKRAEEMLDRPSRTIDVEVITLDDLFDSLGNRPVHWLKVDVEGFEKEALTGWDTRRHRPWVIVVEATLPNSRVPNHEGWEPLILAGGYSFAYFDGLNRFYVADEHPELIEDIQRPPTVFDGFISYGEARKDGEITRLQSQLVQALRKGASGTGGDAARDAQQIETNRYRAAVFSFERERNLDRPIGGAERTSGRNALKLISVASRKASTLMRLLTSNPGQIPDLLKRNLAEKAAASAAVRAPIAAAAAGASPYRFWLEGEDADVTTWQKLLSGVRS